MHTAFRRSFAFRAAAIGLATSVSMLGFAFTAAPASADISPAACLSNDFVLTLSKSVSVAYDETNPNGASIITYTAFAGNPNSDGHGCDVDDVTITLTDPHGVSHTIQTSGSYPVGTPVAALPTTVTYTAASGDEVSGKLTATDHASGALHDTPTGTDPLSRDNSVTITVIHPNTTVTISPSATTVMSGGTVNLTVTEHNTGDDPITSPSVTVDNSVGTLTASSTSFTGGDTGSDGILGVGETWTWVVTGVVVNSGTTYTATGDGLDSLSHHVTFSAYPNERASTTVSVINNPTIATTLSNLGPVTVGTTVHDSSALTGATTAAGGTVTYHAYAGANTCSGTDLLHSTKSVTNHIVTDSDPITLNTAGTYSFQAVYSGDANNTAATSTCTSEQLVVNPATPTITTTLSSLVPVNVGTPVHDSATLHNATSNATGTVAYNVYTDSACTMNGQSAGTKTVAGGIVPDSDPITFNTTGDFYWQATYSGDLNNTGPVKSTCTEEHLVVQQGTPTLTTTASAAVTVGGNISDVAHLAGGNSPQGHITFNVYGPGDSSCNMSLDTLAATPDPVTGDGDFTSANFVANATGTYMWIAHYTSSDSSNLSTSTKCGDANESVVVSPKTPTISTTLSATTVNVNTAVHDGATIIGATSDASGTVTYNVYSGSSCTGTPVFTNTQTVTAGPVVPNSTDFTPTAAGTYNWQAVYSGDGKNAGATSPCQTEVLTVVQPAGQYCSPGYWKVPQHADSWVTYTLDQNFSAVFGRTITILFQSAKGKPQPLPDPTLVQALGANGGGINLIAREAVDALLNASALQFGFTTAQVITAVQNAIDANNPSLLDQFNITENCPLN